ncbi:MAG: hypothetical protein GX444_15030 [Myxococcales bacterium]|nr:hypothetical protein [Myxococcales bacterium]
MKKRVLILLLLLGGAAPAWAVDVGGDVYFQYSYTLPTYDSAYDPRSSNNDFSAFDITRARLELFGEPQPNWLAHLATDVERVHDYQADVNGDGKLEDVTTPDAGRFALVLRYAHLNWQPKTYVGVDAGIIETPWIGFVDQANGFRFVDRLLAERAGWLGQLTDVGLAVKGDFPGHYGSYRAQIDSGNGAQDFEASKQKAGEGRVTFVPAFAAGVLGHFSLSLGGRYNTSEDPPGPALDRDAVGMALLHYRCRYINAGLEGSLDSHWGRERQKPTSNGMAATGWLSVKPWPWFEPFARGERFDPDLDSSGRGRAASRLDGETLAADRDGFWGLLAGLGFHPINDVDAALAGRITWFDETYRGGPHDGETIAPAASLLASLAFSF